MVEIDGDEHDVTAVDGASCACVAKTSAHGIDFLDERGKGPSLAREFRDEL